MKKNGRTLFDIKKDYITEKYNFSNGVDLENINEIRKKRNSILQCHEESIDADDEYQDNDYNN